MNSTIVASLALALLTGLSACADDKPAASTQSSGPSSGVPATSPSDDNPAVIASNAAGQLVQIDGAGEDVFAVVATSEPTFNRGVGIDGMLLTLTNGRCIGLALPSKPYGPVQEVVVVWPPGTTFSVEGGEISVTSEGRTVTIGDRIKGGSNLSYDLATLGNLLPPGCEEAKLRQVGLS